MLRDILDFLDTNKVWVFCIFVVIVLLCVHLADEVQWKTFSLEHNCRLVSIQRATTQSAIVGSKTGLVTVPEKRCYICDDSITYYR